MFAPYANRLICIAAFLFALLGMTTRTLGHIDIQWMNQSQSGFNASEKAVIESAIALWESLVHGIGVPIFEVEINKSPRPGIGATVVHTPFPHKATITIDDGTNFTFFLGFDAIDENRFNQDPDYVHLFRPSPGSTSHGKVDFFEVVAHELGHALGFSETYNTWASATDDMTGKLTYGSGTATLDGTSGANELSHLKHDIHPNDLMAEVPLADIKLGNRYLPTELDLDIFSGVYGFAVHPKNLPVAERRWSGANGAFSNAANWDRGIVPDASDWARFRKSGSYAISLTGDVTNSRFIVSDAVSLDTSGFTYSLTSVSSLADSIVVGDKSDDSGSLSVSGGGTLSGRVVSIARLPGSTGDVVVTNGSVLQQSRGLVIGEQGQGQLTVEKSGSVRGSGGITVGSGNFGTAVTSNGMLKVTGNGSNVQISSSIHVGAHGDGTFIIEGRGTVGSSGGVIGGCPVTSCSKPTGTALVTGAGSKWDMGQGLLGVGDTGTGTLTISDGGVVTNGLGDIANYFESKGSVVVRGINSTWTNLDDLYVGDLGAGSLVVEGGGSVSNGNGCVACWDIGSLSMARVEGAGSIWTNSARLDVGMYGTGTLTITDGGKVLSMDGAIGTEAGSSGTVIANGADSQWNVSEDLTVGGVGLPPKGVGMLALVDEGHVTVGRSVKVGAKGTIDLVGGGAVDVGEVAVAAGARSLQIGLHGTLSGDGTIIGNVFNNGGVVSPGTSPGLLHIRGNYHQESNATLAVEIAGTPPGTGFDVLAIDGDATLDGLLVVELRELNGAVFAPALGDEFDIVTATTGFGTTRFATSDLPTLSSTLQWNLNYGVEVVTLAVGLAGDYNHNGTVDAADYAVWRDTLGWSGTSLAADGNGDNLISGLDYVVWKRNFGNTAARIGSVTNARVPEPILQPLAVLVAVAGWPRVRGRSSLIQNRTNP